MQVKISRWGESLGVRIPKDLAAQVGVASGSSLEATVEEGRIVLTPSVPRYRLAELLKDTTPEALRESFEWDEPRGREIV